MDVEEKGKAIAGGGGGGGELPGRQSDRQHCTCTSTAAYISSLNLTNLSPSLSPTGACHDDHQEINGHSITGDRNDNAVECSVVLRVQLVLLWGDTAAAATAIAI